MIVYPRVIIERMRKGIGSTRVDQATIQFEPLKSILERIQPHSLLDLGCGWAIIDILIARHIQIDEIHLVDGDGTGEKKSGFKDDTKAWNDVNFGAEIVRLNLQTNTQVIEHFADPDKIDVRVDLVISCRSWGHHYPISVYSDTVRRCLKPGGHVITDVRNQTDGLEQLKDMGLRVVEQIPDKSLKCTRWLLEDVR